MTAQPASIAIVATGIPATIEDYQVALNAAFAGGIAYGKASASTQPVRPACFADWQDSHATDRGCGDCNLRYECRTGQPEQEPVAWESILGAVARGCCYEENANKTLDTKLAVAIAKEVQALYTTPPQRKPLSDAQAYEIGKKGGEPSEAERLLFEAWMRGHCWSVMGEWDGETYKHDNEEANGWPHPGTMLTRQLWAAWRDRAALEAAHGIKGDA